MVTGISDFQEQIQIARDSVVNAFQQLHSLLEQRKLHLLAYLSQIEVEFNLNDRELGDELNQLNDCNEAIERIVRKNAFNNMKEVMLQPLKERQDVITSKRNNQLVHFKMDECIYQMINNAGELTTNTEHGNLINLYSLSLNDQPVLPFEDRSNLEQVNVSFIPSPINTISLHTNPEIRSLDNDVIPKPIDFPQVEYSVNPSELTLVPRDYSKMENPTSSFGHKGTKSGEFHNPEGIAIDPNSNKIFVADCYNHRIQVFSLAGEFFYEFPPLGYRNICHPHCLTYPGGVCIHGPNVYITEHPFNLPQGLKVYTTEGVFRAGIHLDGSNDCRLNITDVRGVAVGVDNNIYICDYTNQRIIILTQELAYCNDITNLSGPIDIKARASYIAVLDDGDPCICILSYKGEVLNKIISRGDDESGFINSSFFDIDPFDNFVLSDRDNQCFYVFSLEGDLIHCVSLHGENYKEEEPEEEFEPTGIVFTRSLSIVCISCFRSENILQIF